MSPLLPRAASDIPQKPEGSDGAILEAWAQGYMVGSLVILAAITVANMRKGVLLHKLILIELIFGMPHGFFMFPKPPVYGLFLSSTAVFLNVSWILHNVIAWIKNKPFLGKKVSYLYIGTVMLSVPYWGAELYANFTFFNWGNRLFIKLRPYEVIFRDPWWLFTACSLFYNIVRKYEFGLIELIRVSPRFGVMLASMLLSLAFIVVDVCSVTEAVSSTLPQGINPFWKLAFVFKCLTDAIILDDFKTALDRLKEYRLQRMNSTTLSMNSDEYNNRRPSAHRGGSGPYNESRGITELEKRAAKAQLKERKDSTWNNSAFELRRGARRPTVTSTNTNVSPSRMDSISDEANVQGRNDFNHIDLEMAYWTQRHAPDEVYTAGSSSHGEGSSGVWQTH